MNTLQKKRSQITLFTFPKKNNRGGTWIVPAETLEDALLKLMNINIDPDELDLWSTEPAGDSD
jgi:hypothetical protein